MDTKLKLIDAALATLREKGFAGTTARAISGRAGVNQALIYYHFGGIEQLLMAALDQVSERRMARYEARLPRVEGLPDLVALARTIYQQDLETGDVTVLAELIGGSLRHEQLGPQVLARLEPWVDYTARAIERALEDTSLQGSLPVRDLARGVVAFYLGVDLLHQLDPQDDTAGRLFEHAARLAPVLGTLGDPAAAGPGPLGLGDDEL